MLARSAAMASAGTADAEAEARLVEETLQRVEHLLTETSYADAIQALEAVLPLARGRLLTRTRLLLARSYLKNPRGARQAEVELTTVLQQEPSHVEAHLMLGRLYRDRGLRARRRFLPARPRDRPRATRRPSRNWNRWAKAAWKACSAAC